MNTINISISDARPSADPKQTRSPDPPLRRAKPAKAKHKSPSRCTIQACNVTFETYTLTVTVSAPSRTHPHGGQWQRFQVEQALEVEEDLEFEYEDDFEAADGEEDGNEEDIEEELER